MKNKVKITLKKPAKKFVIKLKKSFKGNPNGKKLV